MEDLWLYLLLKSAVIVRIGAVWEVCPKYGAVCPFYSFTVGGPLVFNVYKWNCYSHSLLLIIWLEKQLEKLCLITAELFPHGFFIYDA